MFSFKGIGPATLSLIPNDIIIRKHKTIDTRLNLIIPVVSEQFSYGGPPTALRFFESLSRKFEYTRVIVTRETESQFDFHAWAHWATADEDAATRSIVLLGDTKTSLSVSPSDIFIATLWNTALYARHIISCQVKCFPETNRRFVYLIQDYEPGFYPWSEEHIYAKSSYGNGDDVIAVFNTQYLADYFRARHLKFSEDYAFEPVLHPRMREMRAEIIVPKERLILAYGRPGAARNAFGLVVEALKIWSESYPAASEWSVISVGESHENVSLSGGVVVQSRGKLGLDEYVRYLSRSWVGLSFMFSPHPSYPPLEMAEFDSWVITNSFENKDLSVLAPNIVSLREPTPEVVARNLASCCAQYRPGQTCVLSNHKPIFKSDTNEFPFEDTLIRSWCGR